MIKVINIEQIKNLIKQSPEKLISFLGDNLMYDDGEDIKIVKVDKQILDQIKKNKIFIIRYSNMHTIVELKDE